MQFITVMAVAQLQGISNYNFTFLSYFPGLTKFKDFPKREQKFRTFPECGNPATVSLAKSSNN